MHTTQIINAWFPNYFTAAVQEEKRFDGMVKRALEPEVNIARLELLLEIATARGYSANTMADARVFLYTQQMTMKALASLG